MGVDDSRAAYSAIQARRPTLVQRANPIAEPEIRPAATVDRLRRLRLAEPPTLSSLSA